MASTTETKQHLFDVLKGFDTAMLVTHSSRNGLHARADGSCRASARSDMYFSTSLQSPKIAEISLQSRSRRNVSKSLSIRIGVWQRLRRAR